MHGTNEAREGHLLKFVVDEVTDRVGEGEAGRSGCQGGPVYGDGHLHGFWCLVGSGKKEWWIWIWRVTKIWALSPRDYLRQLPFAVGRHFLAKLPI